MRVLLAILVCYAAGAQGQFQLFFGTQPPAPAGGGGSGGFDPNCKDAINNCDRFPKSSCVAPYEQWARTNCNSYCGYCNGPTTAAPPCVDAITNCESYGKTMCTLSDYQQWAGKNCRRYCRMCPASVLAVIDAQVTTLNPANCVDKIPDCKDYGQTACSGKFKPWAEANCAYYCGFCVGLPSTAPPCRDSIPNCSAYNLQSTCSNNINWAESNCRQSCGLCGQAIRTPPPPGGGSGGGFAVPTPPMPGK